MEIFCTLFRAQVPPECRLAFVVVHVAFHLADTGFAHVVGHVFLDAVLVGELQSARVGACEVGALVLGWVGRSVYIVVGRVGHCEGLSK